MRRVFFVPAIVLMMCSTAFADLEHLSMRQSVGNTILMTLSGDVFYCGMSGPIGSPVVSIVGNQITVTSPVVFGECPQPLPGFVPPPPQPYNVTVDVGHLVDGTYQVRWVFAISGTGVLSFTSTFRVIGGSLIPSVPVLSQTALVAFAAALAATGFFVARRL